MLAHLKTWNWQDNPAAVAGFPTAPTMVDDDRAAPLDQIYILGATFALTS